MATAMSLCYLESFSRTGLSLESRVVAHVSVGAISVRSRSKMKGPVPPLVPISGRSSWKICGTEITHNGVHDVDREDIISLIGHGC